MSEKFQQYAFPLYLIPIQVLVVILFAVCTEYDSPLTVTTRVVEGDTTYHERQIKSLAQGSMMDSYGMMMDATAMCVMGFGFLYGFSKFYVWSGIGNNFFLCGFCFMWCCVCKCFISSMWEGHFVKTPLNIESTITADLVSAAVLISFGAVYGFVSPTQLILVAIIEPFLMMVNEHIVVENLHVFDAGGSLVTHAFGAYFGIAMCFAMGVKATVIPANHRATTYWSDMGAMIGCIVLWMFWPSFNGAMLYDDPSLQQRVVLNTYLAICGSCTIAFATSCFLHKGKFEMLEIQNATLAGGVCIGMSCSFEMAPWGAVLVGSVGGLISGVGYGALHPILEGIGITDSAGVQMLHGIPGIFGAIVAAFGVLCGNFNYMFSYETKWHDTRDCDRTRGQQFGYIMAAIVVTLVISIAGGIITGLLARLPLCIKVKHENMLLDHDYWHVHDHHHDPRENPETEGGTIIFNKAKSQISGIPVPDGNAITNKGNKYVLSTRAGHR